MKTMKRLIFSMILAGLLAIPLTAFSQTERKPLPAILDFNDSETLDALKSDGVLMACKPAQPVDTLGALKNMAGGLGTNVPQCGEAKPNPLMLVVEISPAGSLKLNGQVKGNILRENTLSEKLREVFKGRQDNGVYRAGTTSVETTVTIAAPPRIDSDIFSRTLKILRDSGASPVNFYVDENIKEANIKVASESPSPQIMSAGVVNGKAISFVRPQYSPAAKAVGASGTVNVSVTIDTKGNVISASAISGHALLRPAAEEAARATKFYPTILKGAAIPVTGTIVYSFVP